GPDHYRCVRRKPLPRHAQPAARGRDRAALCRSAVADPLQESADHAPGHRATRGDAGMNGQVKANLSTERLLQVLLAPIVTEKATFVADKNRQFAFRVVPDATKPEIKAAVELLFKAQVESVQVLNTKGKNKRFGR